MKTMKRILLLLLVCVLMPLYGIGSAENGAAEPGQVLAAGNPDQVFEEGERTGMNGIQVVSLHGTWYEMGRPYGALLQKELAEVYSFVEAIPPRTA